MMFSFDDANKQGKDAMENMLKSYTDLAKGLQAMATEATEYSKKSYEDNASVLEQLFSAKSVEKALEIQSEYAKSSYEDFVSQATKMGEMYSDVTQTAIKPYEAAMPKAVAAFVADAGKTTA